jgi:heme/copper-type cytochrome/quinol oxidase subunit 2
MKDKQFNIAFSVMMTVIVLVVLIIGYIAIFKHRDCMTRQDTRELVDSMLMEIYD